MKLITEHTNEIEYLVEGKGKEQYIKGIFMQSDIKNQNGRVYPHAVLKKEVSNFNNKYVKEGRALGELGHPMGPVINLDRVSHVIKELKEDGVQGDFVLSTVDIVADPSAPDAFVNGIMEGKEWVWENGVIKEQDIDAMKKTIMNAKMKELDQKKLEVFQKFLQNL